MDVQELVHAFVEQLRADGRAPNTTAQVRRHGLVAAKFFGAREVESIDPQDVARLLVSAIATKTPDGGLKKATSQNAMRSSIRCLFAYAHAAGFATTNAARLVRRARTVTPPPRALSDRDRGQLVSELDRAVTHAERRDHALFSTLLLAGLRIGSAVAARVEDLDLDEGVLRLRTVKGGHEDVVFISPSLAEILRGWIGERRDGVIFPASDGGPLTPRQAHRRLARIAQRAEISRTVSPHHLRHTFGQCIYTNTADILVVARALCHRSTASTQVYARADSARVRAAVGA
jgi:site-specific recombinase XerD